MTSCSLIGILSSKKEGFGSSNSLATTDCSTRRNSMESNESLEFAIFNDKYYIVKELGEGSTSSVYLCESIQDLNKKVALKIFKKEIINRNKKNVESFKNEVAILSSCNHKNIIKLIDYGY